MVNPNFYNEQIVSSDHDFFIHESERERSLVVLANKLFNETTPGRYRGDSSTRMISKLSRLLEYTRGKDMYRDITLHLDNYIDEVISVGAKRVIYVSCDPVTLARDLNIFKEYYNIKEISLFEMFPNTHHVESVCLFEKK